MNRRLERIQALIPQGRGVIDVGTDHGYLPAALAKAGYPGVILASDINDEPLHAAKRTAQAAGVTDKIRFLLCDGLHGCDPEAVDTLVLAGMGGDLICRILDEAEWTMDPQYTMILQPMTKAEVLRYWLSNNDYGIVREDLVEDGGKLYSILTVRFGTAWPLTDAELFTGSRKLLAEDPLFQPFLEAQITRMEKALAGMEEGSDMDVGKHKLYAEVLCQMREMR
ncbi:MAG: SAM-dependent methyltransferase [Oscillospiraceae bacterium]|nr:SAM-dependent methyltransferase [Oscillospiraceae bacterium]